MSIDTKKYALKLYITGHSTLSDRAVANLERIGREDLAGRYELEVVDLVERPELAHVEHIIATPTLIKYLPPPPRRVIGDLSNRDKVLSGLDLVNLDDEADR